MVRVVELAMMDTVPLGLHCNPRGIHSSFLHGKSDGNALAQISTTEKTWAQGPNSAKLVAKVASGNMAAMSTQNQAAAKGE